MKRPEFTLQSYVNYKFLWIPFFIRRKLMWKDKFNSPRCEREPYFKLEWLWFGVYGVWGDDDYWEQWLWVYKYCGGDEEKAKETWGWVDFETKESTWIDY